MNKLIAVLSFGLFVVAMSGNAEAASARGGAKTVGAVTYTTTVSSVAVRGPAAVYQVVLSTGTAGTDHVALFDAATTVGITVGVTTGLRAKINVSSSTQNTVVTFDPPLQFNNGIVAANSAATMWSLITYERGRITQQ